MVELKNCYKSYDGGKTYILKDLNLLVKPKEMIAITGESGSGKSTLLNILGTLDKLDNGKYIFDGNNVSKMNDKEITKVRNKSIGFVFQQYFLIPYLNVLENVMIPLRYSKEKNKDKEKAIEIINNLGLSEVMNNDVNLLSGGEMQRVSIARALVNNPHLLLCDEPTGNLDNVNKELIMDMLTRLNNEGMTIIIVTHDLNIAKRCHRHYLLRNWRLELVKPED